MPRREDTSSDFILPTQPDLVWVEPGFALGSRPYAHQRGAIVELGIRVVVALQQPEASEAEDWQALGATFVRISTPDWVEIPAAVFDRAVEVVSSCLQSKEPVLLHCLAGLNRAPTVAAAILCRTRALGVEAALGAVKRARPAARPTPEQEKSLRLWFGMRCQSA